MRTEKPKLRHCFLLYSETKNKSQIEEMLKEKMEDLSIRSYIISNNGSATLVSLRLFKPSFPNYLSRILGMELAKHDAVSRYDIPLEYDKFVMNTSDPAPVIHGIPPSRQEILLRSKTK